MSTIDRPISEGNKGMTALTNNLSPVQKKLLNAADGTKIPDSMSDAGKATSLPELDAYLAGHTLDELKKQTGLEKLTNQDINKVRTSVGSIKVNPSQNDRAAAFKQIERLEHNVGGGQTEKEGTAFAREVYMLTVQKAEKLHEQPAIAIMEMLYPTVYAAETKIARDSELQPAQRRANILTALTGILVRAIEAQDARPGTAAPIVSYADIGTAYSKERVNGAALDKAVAAVPELTGD